MIYVLQCGQCARQFVATDDEHGDLVLKFARHMRDEHSPGLAEWTAPQVWRLEMPQQGVAGLADPVDAAAVRAPVRLIARSADRQNELVVQVGTHSIRRDPSPSGVAGRDAMCLVSMGQPDAPVYQAWLTSSDLLQLAQRLVQLLGPETP